jgi:hypothetical protein
LAWAVAASARSQPTIGLVLPSAKTVNSRDTQTRSMGRSIAAWPNGRPGVPNSDGR